MLKPVVLLFLLLIFSTKLHSQVKGEFELAMSNFEAGKFEQANTHILKAINSDKNNVSYQLLFAKILLELNKNKMALDVLKIADNLGADYNALYVLKSKALLQLGEYQRVLDQHQQLSRNDNISADIYAARGLAWFGLKNFIKAEESLKQALFIDPNNNEAKIGLTKIDLQNFDYIAANKHIEEVTSSLLPPIEALNLKATIAQQLGNHAKAFEAIQLAITRHPNNLYSKLINASLNVEVGNYQKANQNINDILKQIPNEPRALFLSAVVAINNKSDIEIKEQLSKIEVILSKLSSEQLNANPNFYYLLSLILFQQQKFTESHFHLNSYLLLDPNNLKAIYLKSLLLIKMGQYQEAQITLKKADAIKPNDAKVAALQGVVYQRLNKHELAKNAFEKVLEINPLHQVAVSYLAQSYLSLGETKHAIQVIKQAEVDTLETTSVLVNAYLQSNDYDEALRIAKNNVQSHKDSSIAHHLLASIFHFGQESELAKEHYETALNIDENNIKSIIGLAYLMLQEGEGNKAILSLKNATEKYPKNSELLGAIANIYQALGKLKHSINFLQKEYQNSPNKNSVTELVNAYRLDEQVKKAEEVLSGYISQGISDFSLYYLQAEIQLQLGNYKQAIFSFKDALKSDLNKGEIYYRIAQTYYFLSEFKNAETYYKKSIAWSDYIDLPSYSLAKLYSKRSQNEKAIKVILQYEALYPTSIPLTKLKANIYLSQNEIKKAEKAYTKLSLLGELEQSSIGLAQVNIRRNRLTKALNILNKAETKLPKSLLIKTLIAQISILKNDWEHADGVYSELLLLYPDNAALFNNAAYIKVKLNDLDGAEKLAKKSISLFDNHPDSLHTLGLIYYKQKRYEDSLPLLRKATALKYKNVEAQYHLALTLKALQRDSEALSVLVKAVESGIEFPEQKQAELLVKEWSS